MNSRKVTTGRGRQSIKRFSSLKARFTVLLLPLAFLLALSVNTGCADEETTSPAAFSQEGKKRPSDESFERSFGRQRSKALAFEEIFVHIPRKGTRGFVADDRPEDLEGVYLLKGWLGSELRGSITKDRFENLPDAPAFRALQRLLKAYVAGDVDAVLKVYDEESRSKIESKLASDKIRNSWLQSVRKIRAFHPLVLWASDDHYFCAMKASQETESGTADIDFAVMFNDRFELVSGAMTSTFSRNLTLFFADSSRSPQDLVANLDYVKQIVQSEK